MEKVTGRETKRECIIPWFGCGIPLLEETEETIQLLGAGSYE
jgi:hypothetical protein